MLLLIGANKSVTLHSIRTKRGVSNDALKSADGDVDCSVGRGLVASAFSWGWLNLPQ